MNRKLLSHVLLVTVGLLGLSTSSLSAAGPKLGQPCPDFALKDYRGKEVKLADVDASVVVLAFLGTECPLAKLYSARLQEIYEAYPRDQVEILAVYANKQDSLEEIGAAVRRHEMTFPALKDAGNKVADLVGASRTPEVVLLDQHRNIQYRGRVDDQYVIGIVRDKAERHDLREAMDELLAGKKVSVAQTEPLGCFIGRVREVNNNSSVTYSNQISRIFQSRCVECHRDGEIAPFNLTSFDDASGWGEAIVEVLDDRRMPPWHANPEHGAFANDRSMPEEEKELVREWVKNGCPEGNPKELPKPLEFVSGWQLGEKPHAKFDMRKEPFKVPAEAGPNGVAYQNFWVNPNFKEDKWIAGAEVKPGNRAVVHHIIVYVHSKGKGTREDGFLTAYVPGLRSDAMPEGAAKRIPAGAWLRFQVHYTPIGSKQEDLSTVGLVFADPKKVTHEVKTVLAGNNDFALKPNEKDQRVDAKSRKSPVPVTLISMSPHMHLRGQSFRYEIILPDGTREILLDVPEYDFNWQTRYRLKEPRELPAGTQMFCTALFDNSAENLANPDPSKTIRWGDQSWDEMMIGYYDIVIPRVPDELDPTKGTPSEAMAKMIKALKRADKNKDGQISKAESKAIPILNQAFGQVDTNGDGQATVKEIADAVNKLRKNR